MSNLKPALYLVATPIGNLGDMSYRAVETLKSVSTIYCEDTRVAAKLLRHYDIRTRTQAYHEHNADKQRPRIQSAIESGEAIALISDAGMPLISDPGYKLVRELSNDGVTVTSIPGCTATLTGLQLSGLPTDRFLFAGFLPQKDGAKRALLKTFAATPATVIYFDTAPRVANTCAVALEVLGDRPAAIARELTKMFEEVIRGTLSELIEKLSARDQLRGELVLIIDRAEDEEQDPEQVDAALLDALKDLPTKQAANQVAEHFGLPKRDVYQRALELKNGETKDSNRLDV
ncbi:MAG: 16S rRNA (cytidine(1402)-2'-O)-methyltransferase [Alphaproteobacteria bacterium]